MGVGDQPHLHLFAHRAQQLVHQRGLARTHLAGDQRDRRTGDDPVFQHRVGALVGGRPEQEIGIGHQRKGALGQSEKACVDVNGAVHANS